MGSHFSLSVVICAGIERYTIRARLNRSTGLELCTNLLDLVQLPTVGEPIVVTDQYFCQTVRGLGFVECFGPIRVCCQVADLVAMLRSGSGWAHFPMSQKGFLAEDLVAEYNQLIRISCSTIEAEKLNFQTKWLMVVAGKLMLQIDYLWAAAGLKLQKAMMYCLVVAIVAVGRWC